MGEGQGTPGTPTGARRTQALQWCPALSSPMGGLRGCPQLKGGPYAPPRPRGVYEWHPFVPFWGFLYMLGCGVPFSMGCI